MLLLIQAGIIRADMNTVTDAISRQFGNKLRVRVCGICIEQGKILLVNHKGLNASGEFWAPPGGGIEFGSSAEENLIREFKEETGLIIEIDKFLFVHEYLQKPIHAIELFFSVRRLAGTLIQGTDPEMKQNEQIIHDVRFMGKDEIGLINKNNRHQIFHGINDLEKIHEVSGYYLT